MRTTSGWGETRTLTPWPFVWSDADYGRQMGSFRPSLFKGKHLIFTVLPGTLHLTLLSLPECHFYLWQRWFDFLLLWEIPRTEVDTNVDGKGV